YTPSLHDALPISRTAVHGVPNRGSPAPSHRGITWSRAMTYGSREFVRSSDTKRPAVLSTAPAATAWPSHSPPTDRAIDGRTPVVHWLHGRAPLARAAPTGRMYAAVSTGSARNIADRNARSGERASPRHGDVDEAVDPAPPADLERPVRPDRLARPRDVAAFVRHRRRELGHHQGDRRAPENRREHQQRERHARTERGNGVLDPVGPAAHVEEDDRGEREDPEPAPEPCRQLTSPGRRRSAAEAPRAIRRSGERPRP